MSLFLSILMSSVIAPLIASGAIQNAAEPSPPRVFFAVTSKSEVPFLGGLPGMMIAGACNSDGTMFVRMRSDPTSVVSISANGKNVVRFAAEKAIVAANPRAGSFFSDGRSIYVLISGSEDIHPVRLKGQTSDGQSKEVVVQNPQRVSKFIVSFNDDGTYKGATKLDLPFQPIQIAVFPGGSFLVAGLDPQYEGARIALVKWNGQFDRYVELKDDVQRGEGNGDNNRDMASRYGLDRADLSIRSTQIIPVNGKLLLRRGQDAKVYEISESGEVRMTQLNLPAGFVPQTIVVADRRWVAVSSRRRTEGMGLEYAFYAFDPQTGQVLEELVFPEPMGAGLACATDSELTFLRQTREGTVVIWKASRKTGLADAAGESIRPN